MTHTHPCRIETHNKYPKTRRRTSHHQHHHATKRLITQNIYQPNRSLYIDKGDVSIMAQRVCVKMLYINNKLSEYLLRDSATTVDWVFMFGVYKIYIFFKFNCFALCVRKIPCHMGRNKHTYIVTFHGLGFREHQPLNYAALVDWLNFYYTNTLYYYYIWDKTSHIDADDGDHLQNNTTSLFKCQKTARAFCYCEFMREEVY